MKKYFAALIAGLLFSIGIYAQRANPFATPILDASEEELSAIDKVKDEIKNNISNYKKSEKYKDSTGYRNAYYSGNELQLIASCYKDTSTEKHVDWYFQNGQLIFSEQLWTDRKTNDTIDYGRYYLTNEHLIAWYKFDKPVNRNSDVFKKISSAISDYVVDLKDENMK